MKRRKLRFPRPTLVWSLWRGLKTRKKPFVIGHRGSSGTAPENTLASFHQAIDAGADMVELDVRLTKDFFLVVLHDRDVRRTTNGSGKIWNLTLEELRRLDAGSWFSPEFTGERIPTLRQVMELLPQNVLLNMEVKTDGDPRKRIAMEEACILAVLEKKFEERVLISSFDHRFLRRLHFLYPRIPTGALYHPVRDAAKKPSGISRRIGAGVFICGRTQLRQRFVDDARAHKIMTACYVVNTPQQLEKVVRLGVNAVVTDFPKRMVQEMKRR